MAVRIAINGLGRIGRCVIRALSEFKGQYGDDIELVAVNGSAPLESHIHFLKYDSVHGIFRGELGEKGGNLLIDGREVVLLQERDPARLPWGDLGVDIVMECTGKFTTAEGAGLHLQSGAKKVMISAPGKGDGVKTIVYAVNNEALTSEDKIVSIGSCTTNCLAPVAKVLNDAVGIKKGFMTTIHSYTNDQRVLDGSHKDLRRARACALSMIPTSTGAAKALGLVLPELQGRLDGGAIRVPTPNVSLVDLNFLAERKTTVNEINGLIAKAATGSMRGVLQFANDPLVSIDFTHNSHSSIFDATQTRVNDDMVKVFSWYDNEWGFSVRMLDVAKLMA